MHWVIVLMLLGVVTFAGAVVHAAIQMPEAPPEALHPAVACLLEWNCVGPVAHHKTLDGVEYSEYVCDHGVFLLRRADPEA